MREIAVMVPTRKRYDSLVECVESLARTCDDPGSYEVMAVFDEDDAETRRRFEAFVAERGMGNVRVLVTERMGWARQHDYFDMMCRSADPGTRWLVCWGDDVYMTGKGWDSALLRGFGDGLVLPWVSFGNDEWANNQFPYNPVMPMEWYRQFGFPRHRQYDWYLKEIAKGLGLFRKHSDLWATRAELPDPETGRRQRYVNGMTREEKEARDSVRARLRGMLGVEEPARTRKAVATFADRRFLPGLEVMVHSLLRHTPLDTREWELVVLSNELTEEELARTRRMWPGMTLRRFDEGRYAEIGRRLREAIPGANGSYHKFELFGLGEYARVVALDSDLLFLQDASELFECEAPMAAVKELLIDQYNSGVMSIGGEFLGGDAVSRLVRSAEIMGPGEHADQDVISAHFSGDLAELPICLNFLKIYYNYPFLHKYPFPPHIKVLHYIIHKPWLWTGTINEIEIGTEGLNAMWHAAYEEMRRSLG